MRQTVHKIHSLCTFVVRELDAAFILLFPWQTMINLSFNCVFLFPFSAFFLLFSFVRKRDSSISFTANLQARTYTLSHPITFHIHFTWKQLIYILRISFYAFKIANDFKNHLWIWFIIHFVSSVKALSQRAHCTKNKTHTHTPTNTDRQGNYINAFSSSYTI